MEEYKALMLDCLERYHITPCGSEECRLGLYCVNHQPKCELGVCNSCLSHIQWHPSPTFSYSCKRITYHYVLRFFNRFASEIYYAMSKYKQEMLDSTNALNIVSLGCGPGSEVYGIIRNVRSRAAHVQVNYQGYDKNEIWEEVQNLSKEKLSQSGHNVDFYNRNLFQEYVGFQDNHIDILVLNYLLSDCQKFYTTDTDREKFVSELAHFIIYKNVRNILFNDINFYGKRGKKLDSGIKMLKLLIGYLEKWEQTVWRKPFYFQTDNFVPTPKWFKQPDDRLVFENIAGNKLDNGLSVCKSKQVLCYIEPQQ